MNLFLISANPQLAGRKRRVRHCERSEAISFSSRGASRLLHCVRNDDSQNLFRSKKNPATQAGVFLSYSKINRLELHGPAIDIANIASSVVIDAKFPNAVGNFTGSINRHGFDDVVRASAGAVVDVVERTIWCD